MLGCAVWVTLALAFFREVVGNPTITHIGTYNLTIAEPIVIISGSAFFILIFTSRIRKSLITTLIFSFYLIFAVNIIRGVTADFMPAIVSLRATGAFAFLLLLATISTRSGYLIRKTGRVLTLTSLGLCVLIFLRFIYGPFLFMQTENMPVEAFDNINRPLSAQGAFLVACASTLVLSQILRNRGGFISLNGLILAILISGLVLTQQGTATIAGATGLIVVWFLEAGRTRGVRAYLSLLILALFVLAFVLDSTSLGSSSWNGLISHDLYAKLMQRQGDLVVRQIVWQSIVAAHLHANLLNQLIGWPAGAGPQLIVQTPTWGKVIWQHAAHSMYFGTLITHGLAGVCIFVAILFLAGMSAVRGTRIWGSSASFISPAASLALIVMTAIMSYSYNLENEEGLVLAIAFSAAQSRLWLRKAKPEPLYATRSPVAGPREYGGSLAAHNSAS